MMKPPMRAAAPVFLRSSALPRAFLRYAVFRPTGQRLRKPRRRAEARDVSAGSAAAPATAFCSSAARGRRPPPGQAPRRPCAPGRAPSPLAGGLSFSGPRRDQPSKAAAGLPPPFPGLEAVVGDGVQPS